MNKMASMAAILKIYFELLLERKANWLELHWKYRDYLFKLEFVYLQKHRCTPRPLATMFLDKSWRLEQSWKRITKEIHKLYWNRLSGFWQEDF